MINWTGIEMSHLGSSAMLLRLTVLSKVLLLTVYSFSCLLVLPVHASEGPYAVFAWTPAHATFYGGQDAQGTMGGACGYGDLISGGYGTATTALSTTLFNSGFTCGACFEIKCDFSSGGYSTKWCLKTTTSITVTGTNLCPPNLQRTTDGWCNPPKVHFDLSYPAFAQLADGIAGIIPVQYRRVACQKTGGVRFQMGGNRWFILVVVSNVGGAGNLVQVSLRGANSQVWSPMTKNWGSVWESHNGGVVGQSPCFRVTSATGQTLVISNVAGSNWQFGATYEANLNFGNTLF